MPKARKEGLISQEELHRVLSYDTVTGKFSWKVKLSRACRENVGNLDSGGYLFVKIHKITYKVHRLVWMYHHGFWPNEVDHINGDKVDNRIENLREATRSQNCFNKTLNRNNKSGYKGVSYHKKKKKWIAQTMIDGKKKHLGAFDDAEQAHIAYCDAAQNYIGEFFNSGQ